MSVSNLLLFLLGASVLLAGLAYALRGLYPQKLWLLAGLALALLGYGLWGQPFLPDAPFANRITRDPAQLPFAANLAQLQAYAQANPTDPQAWQILARARYATGAFTQSAYAWRRALAVLPEAQKAPALFGLAEALIGQADGLVTEVAKQHLQHGLRLSPADPAGLYALALYAKQNGRTAEAQKMWRDLLATLPADSPYTQAIARQLQ